MGRWSLIEERIEQDMDKHKWGDMMVTGHKMFTGHKMDVVVAMIICDPGNSGFDDLACLSMLVRSYWLRSESTASSLAIE
jgi:hypothetical protein